MTTETIDKKLKLEKVKKVNNEKKSFFLSFFKKKVYKM